MKVKHWILTLTTLALLLPMGAGAENTLYACRENGALRIEWSAQGECELTVYRDGWPVNVCTVDGASGGTTIPASGTGKYSVRLKSAEGCLKVNAADCGAEEPQPTAAPEETAAPKETAAPEQSCTPEATSAHEAVAAPEATAAPEVTNPVKPAAAPEATRIPEAAATSEATAVPEATAAPEATNPAKPAAAPEATKTPEAAAAPEATAVPEAMAAPETTNPAKPADAPKATKTPEAAAAPAAIGSTRPADAPAATHPVGQTHTPKETAASVPTAASAVRPVAAQVSSGSSMTSMAAEVVAQVNAERAKYGLGSLAVSDELTRAACVRASEIVRQFSHTRPDGSSCFTVSGAAFGENIAKGQRSADRVMAAWMSSEGHRANILRESYGSIGVCALKVNGVIYWVQLFGK